MQKELDAESYKLKFEKIAAIALAAESLWFSFGEVAEGRGPLGDLFGAFKLGLCVVSLFIGVRIFHKGALIPGSLCGIITVIYNPFLRPNLDSSSWRATDFSTGVIFLWIAWRLFQISKIMTPERIERTRMAEARANAINEAIANGTIDERQHNDFVRKLRGRDDEFPVNPPSRAPATQYTKGDATEKTIHFVLKYPPTGVPHTKDNILITGKTSRLTDSEGNQRTNIAIYAEADPLTLVEARSAIYWRDQIEQSFLSDAQVIGWMQSIGEHTPKNYIARSAGSSHPGEVAITSGLTKLSLHYAIGHPEDLRGHSATIDWIAKEWSKVGNSGRAVDFEWAVNLKDAIRRVANAPEIILHLKNSIT